MLIAKLEEVASDGMFALNGEAEKFKLFAEAERAVVKSMSQATKRQMVRVLQRTRTSRSLAMSLLRIGLICLVASLCP